VNADAEVAMERTEDALVVRVAGEVDMSNAADVGEELVRSVPNDVAGVVLELSNTRYLDSAAIEVIFELARRLQRRRQRLSVVAPDDSPLRRVLTLTDVASVAAMHTSLEEALENP
jgi:anti-anti-sigma factor